MNTVRDLGLTFQSDLAFDRHIHSVVSTAFKKLGFVMRSAKYFRKTSTLRLLYCALVRPHLEFASVVWTPHRTKFCQIIERIQNRSLRRVSFFTDSPMHFFDHSYEIMLNKLRLTKLERRRIFSDLLFLFKLISGHVECSALLERIRLHVPARPLRNNLIFYEEVHRTLYGKFKPLNRLALLANEFSDRVDFFLGSLSSFKRELMKVLIKL